MQRWLHTRAARKFLANRIALVGLGIVSTYLLVALATGVFGIITPDETFERVGPKQIRGFFRPQSPEKRLADAEYILNRMDGIFRRSNPSAALQEFRLGQLHIRQIPIEELQAEVNQGWEIYDQLAVNDELEATPEVLQQLGNLERVVNGLFEPLTGSAVWKRRLELLLGTDAQGRSIAIRGLYSIEIAIRIGSVVAFLSVLIGAVLGTAAGFYGGWIDHLVTWLFTTFSSIPSLVLLVLLAYLFTGTTFEGTLVPMYIAFSATYWIGPCRVIRGETLKLRELEYVQAATALGFSRPYIMLRHILPNASHLMLINFSLLFIAAIKGEVILTYLGLGIKNGTSWGIMIGQSRPEVVNGFFWQIGTATFLMFGLVLAFNILSDALQDAFDPKHVG